ncbi:ABC transporter substrate-binding protein [Caballeronia sp. LZ043]|uniref:ABC transporter substrate-binding protein n=1 Tax=Caballeronia sp. LZ043 TaxID=3038569 RepID=UPI002857E6D7|nr:ABC transporter substrate-binding protein [Caballeronia sp. LZ043]MDR5822468.1 ABC transporter substrate-binding protein [Caballeronia sp. LZ043]
MLKKIISAVALIATTAAPAFADEKVKVLLDWFVNPNHGPIIVAQELGEFKKRGLDVEIVPPADPSMPPRLLAAGQADLALSFQPQLYLLTDKGLPVERVATVIDSPLNTIAALEGGPIKSMKDFKGRKIGYSVSGIEDITIQNMLRHSGVDVSDVQLVNVNFQLVSALLSHRVDGVIGAFRNFETTEIKEKGATPVVFKPEDNGIPKYDELIVISTRDHAHDAKVEKFVQAMSAGTAYIKAHPQEAWKLFIKHHADLDNTLNKTAWDTTVPLFAAEPGKFNKPRYQAYGQYMADNKLIGALKPVDDYGIEVK